MRLRRNTTASSGLLGLALVACLATSGCDADTDEASESVAEIDRRPGERAERQGRVAAPEASGVHSPDGPSPENGSGHMPATEPRARASRHALHPVLEPGARYRYEVHREDRRHVTVKRARRVASTRLRQNAHIAYTLEILSGTKWTLDRFAVEFTRSQQSGDGPPVQGLPTVGERWTCRATQPRFACTDQATGGPRDLPPWFPISLRPLLSNRWADIGSTWSLNERGAALLAAPDTASLDGTLTIEGVASTDNDSTVQIALAASGADAVVTAGERLPLTLRATGSISFDLGEDLVTSYQVELVSRGSITLTQRDAPMVHEREMTTRIRFDGRRAAEDEPPTPR